MRDIIHYFLIFGFCVTLFWLKKVEGTTEAPKTNMATQHTEADPYDYDDDPTIGANCYTEENHCMSALSAPPKPLCVFKKKIGMTNFFGLCTIRLHNCLIKQQKKLKDGSADLNDEIYYNGKSFDCEYYGARFKSEKQAIIWYFKLGGLDAKTENITQPFEIFEDDVVQIKAETRLDGRKHGPRLICT